MVDAQTVFEGHRFRVERRTFLLRGHTHEHDIVVHPGAAVILPVLPDGQIVLIHNYRVAVGGELIELPAGTLDAGESPEVCAARELAEETGYRAGRLEPLVTFYSTPGILTERMYTYLATELTPGETAHESGEQIRVTPMPHAAAIDAVRTGRILDGKTILTLLYYDGFIRGQRNGA